MDAQTVVTAVVELSAAVERQPGIILVIPVLDHVCHCNTGSILACFYFDLFIPVGTSCVRLLFRSLSTFFLTITCRSVLWPGCACACARVYRRGREGESRISRSLMSLVVDPAAFEFVPAEEIFDKV